VTTEVRHDIIATAFDQAHHGDRLRAVSQGAGPCDVPTPNGPPVRLDAVPAVIPEARGVASPVGPPSEGTSRPPPWFARRSRPSGAALLWTGTGAPSSPVCPAPGVDAGRTDPRRTRPLACPRLSPNTWLTAGWWR
jgi:hypothetical protein